MILAWSLLLLRARSEGRGGSYGGGLGREQASSARAGATAFSSRRVSCKARKQSEREESGTSSSPGSTFDCPVWRRTSARVCSQRARVSHACRAVGSAATSRCRSVFRACGTRAKASPSPKRSSVPGVAMDATSEAPSKACHRPERHFHSTGCSSQTSVSQSNLAGSRQTVSFLLVPSAGSATSPWKHVRSEEGRGRASQAGSLCTAGRASCWRSSSHSAAGPSCRSAHRVATNSPSSQASTTPALQLASSRRSPSSWRSGLADSIRASA